LNGELLFDDVSIGTYSYVVEKDGYVSLHGSFEITNGNKTINVYLTPEVIEPETYSVKFIVRDSTDNSLIENAQVTTNNLVGLTNANGTHTFLNLQSGSYTYIASKSGYKLNTGNFEIQDSNQVITIFLIREDTPTPPGPTEPEFISEGGIKIVAFDLDSLDYGDEDSWDYIYVALRNTGNYDKENVRVILSIPELGVWDTAGPFKLSQNLRKDLYFDLDIPNYSPGWYYARLSISSIDYSRSIWYEIYLD